MSGFVEAGGACFIARDDVIVGLRRRTGREFEPATWAWVVERLAERPGPVFDVGASTGWYALRLAALGYAVHAYEPNPQVLRRLRENLDMNWDLDVETYGLAMSDRAGTAPLWVNPAVPLTSGGSIQAPPVAGARQVAVTTTTIDREVQRLGIAPALIKVDVENHESAVLDGAVETLRAHRPFLVLEANTSELRGGLAGRLVAAGYDFLDADERNLLCAPAGGPR